MLHDFALNKVMKILFSDQKEHAVKLATSLILIKDRNTNCLRDQTAAVMEINGADNNRIFVKYCAGGEYYYKKNNAFEITERESLDVSEYKISLSKDGKVLNNLDYLDKLMGPYGNAWKVSLSDGRDKYFRESELEVVKHLYVNNSYRYIREVAEAIKPENGYVDYLTKQFEYMKQAENSALVPFFANNNEVKVNQDDAGPIILPFECNLSQMNAIEMVLNNQFSVIEGPPGTGKTATILNIVANLVFRDKTVLIASPNNHATENVSEKLDEKGLGFLVAELGKKDNKTNFLNNQDKKIYPTKLFENNCISSKEECNIEQLRESIQNMYTNLKQYLGKERALARKREELRIWELEYSRFKKKFPDVESLSCDSSVQIERIRGIRDHLAKCFSEGKRVTFVEKAVFTYVFHIGSWEFYTETLPADMEIAINELVFERTISWLMEEINRDEEELNQNNIADLKIQLSMLSTTLFWTELYSRYKDRLGDKRKIFSADDLDNMKDFVQEYPVITSTTNAAKYQQGKSNEAILFDYLVIDESSQVNLVTGTLALSTARNAVIVGDTKQLPCVITTREEKAAIDARKRIQPEDDRFIFEDNNLLSSAVRGMDCGQIPKAREVLLEHYRCDPLIIGFCNQQFYDGKLISMKGSEASANQVLYMQEIKERKMRKGDYNRAQAREVVNLIQNDFAETKPENIGVVTPYRYQANGMQQDPNMQKAIEVETVHKFQGREKETVFFVTAGNHLTSFLDDSNLVNVAVSRGMNKLILIGQEDVLNGIGNIPNLARYIRYQKGAELSPTTSSIFDLLYPQHAEELEGWKQRNKQLLYIKKNDEISELLFAKLLTSMLKDKCLIGKIGYARNYPLKLLFRNVPLNERELQFINNGSHVDFVLFSTIDRRALCGIEINGAKHFSSRKRKANDALKKEIFRKAGVTLEFFATHDVEEKESLNELLNNIFQGTESETSFYDVVVDDEDGDYYETVGGLSLCESE